MFDFDLLDDPDEIQMPTSSNGAYQGKAIFEGESYADQMIADERRWRENIRRGINEIKALRADYNYSKKMGHKHKMRMLEEDIKNRKQELKDIILARDYEWRE